MSSNEPEIIAVRDLFAEDRYRVPIYQRAFAWGKDEIETLLHDIQDYRVKRDTSSYYLGSLVVHADSHAEPGRVVYEVVDGQQRLTTLFLILCHPRFADHRPSSADRKPLEFEGRARSTLDLRLLARVSDSKSTDRSDALASTKGLQDDGIKTGFETIDRALTSKGNPFTDEDCNYLLDHVKLVRTELPPHTDLNHYFEVMNNRGEQLEKHEIVKAKLLSQLDTASQAPFATLWDACSDLSKHVQAKFVPEVRERIFGANWDTFPEMSFAELAEILKTPSGSTSDEAPLPTSIAEILSQGVSSVSEQGDQGLGDETSRYGSIIDFPNFLLQALKVHYRNEFSWERTSTSEGRQEFASSASKVTAAADAASQSTAKTAAGRDVSLDDKKLIEQFEGLPAEDVKAFIVTLLQLRYLFDKYVIKTDGDRVATDDDSNWVLLRAYCPEGARKKLKKKNLSNAETFGVTTAAHRDALAEEVGVSRWSETLQRQIVVLQSMFQVTDSGRSYKNFLHGILAFLHEYMTGRQRGGQSGETGPASLAPAFVERLNELAISRYEMLRPAGWGEDPQSDSHDGGVAIPHFIFNYLDYLLWRDFTTGRTLAPSTFDAQKFRFRYRTSVEHFYPQHPDEADGHGRLDNESLHSFGNLCLMTRSHNSRRSNLMPKAKVDQYSSTDQSLKFQLMAEITTQEGTWTEDQIRSHAEEMKRRLADPPH